MQQDEIRELALSLPLEARAALIEDLLLSFDPAGREAIDAAWAAEAESRIDAYDRGEMGSVSWEELKARIFN